MSKDRKNALKGFIKKSESELDSIQNNDMSYDRKEFLQSIRSGPKYSNDTENLYNLNVGSYDYKVKEVDLQRGLSSRYSPDRVGEQVMHLDNGIYQSSVTGKIYDYNEGFVTEQGDVYSPSSVANQTKLMYFAKELKSKGLIKEAKQIIEALREDPNFSEEKIRKYILKSSL